MEFKLAVPDPRGVLENGQMGLVMLLVESPGAGRGPGQFAQASADAGRRQVLDPAVVFVPARVLPDLWHGHIPEGAQPRMRIGHDGNLPVRPNILLPRARRAARAPAS